MAARSRRIRREANGSLLSEVTIAGVNHISTTVTRSATTVACWINTTRQAYAPPASSGRSRIVGLEVVCHLDGKIALLQLCVGDRCLIYQLLYSDFWRRDHPELSAFLDDSQFCFCGRGMDVITYGLRRGYCLPLRHTADLGTMAAARLRRDDLRRTGLERLAREVMHLEIEKPDEVRRSAWWQPELSDEQIAYACADAFIALELGKILING